METIIFGQWWRSHQFLACKGFCILRFCVMSWKSESEPNIKCCLGRTVELVQRFTTIQNFGHNWRRADEQFLRVHLSYGCAIILHSITNLGLTAGGQNCSRERQMVFFTAVNPLNKDHKDPHELDLTKTTSCIVQAEEVEKTPGYGVLGRYTAC